MPATTLRFCALLLALFAVFACSGNGEDAPSSATRLRLWFHTGQAAEKACIEAQVQRFHERQDEIRIALTHLPEGTYHQQVQAAALAGELPDLLEIDGPFVASYASQGKLRSLKELLDPALIKDLLPSIVEQGLWQDKLWAVGTFDSGLGIWARRSILEKAGIRIPKGYADAWKGPEFAAALEKLVQQDEDGKVLDLGLQQRGEWISYAFMPLIYSSGGQVIDPETGSCLRALAGPRPSLAFTVLQAWVRSGRVDPNLDEQAFLSGRVGLCWGGHWQYRRFHEKFGEDLLLLPLPDFGKGAKTGQGSWCWGISDKSQHPKAAARFLSFLLETSEVLAMSQANGAVPATGSAIAKSELHRPGAPLALFVEGLTGFAVPRPRSPAYPVITSAFQEAFGHIRDGRPVEIALSRAASQIDAELKKLAEQAKSK
ncbi:MAG: ABC transporter substrate-binding protein [Planctomycetota bacterium]|nr:MAG: ABC transporter substrate-binding protein [Planctomycetota bacterium]